MSKKILSLVLAVCMVILAVPVFVVAASAAPVADESETLQTSSTLNQATNWPKFTMNEAATGPEGTGLYTVEELFGDNWSFGAIQDGTYVPFGAPMTAYAILSQGWNQHWTTGGLYLEGSRVIVLPEKTMAFAYHAPYSGTLALDVNFDVLTAGMAEFAIAVDGTIVYPVDPETKAGVWTDLTTAGAQNAKATVTVTAGQYVEFLFRGKAGIAGERHIGNFDTTVTYTAIAVAGAANYKSDLASLNSIGGALWSELYGRNDQAMHYYLGWSVGNYDADGKYTDFHHTLPVNAGDCAWAGSDWAYENTWYDGYNGKTGDSNKLWYDYSGAFNVARGKVAATSRNTAVAVVYNAEYDGTIVPSISQWNATMTHYIAIMVNDTMVWPVQGGAINDKTIYHEMTANAVDLAALNAELANVSIEVKKGDKVQFSYMDSEFEETLYNPAVTYTEISYKTPLQFNYINTMTGATVSEFVIPADNGVVTYTVPEAADDTFGYYYVDADGNYYAASAFSGTVLTEGRTFYSVNKTASFSPSTAWPQVANGSFKGYAGGWSLGRYSVAATPAYFPLTMYQAQWDILNSGDTWANGGMYRGQDRFITAREGYLALTYQALATGTIDLSISKLSIDRNGDGAVLSDTAMAIVKNGTIIWPTAAAGDALNTAEIYTFTEAGGIKTDVVTDWFYAKLDNDGTTIKTGSLLDQLTAACAEDPMTGIEVTAGDQIQIVFANVNTPHISVHPQVTYTAVAPDAALWDGIKTEVAYKYATTFNSSSNQPVVAEDQRVNGGIAQFQGNWNLVAYPYATYGAGILCDTIINCVDGNFMDTFYSLHGTTQNLSAEPAFRVNSGNAYWGSPCSVTISAEYSAGYQYEAELTGFMNINLASLSVKTGVVAAIFVDGQMVWPNANGDYADTATWYEATDTEDHAAEIMTADADAGLLSHIYVREGQNVELLFKGKTNTQAFWDSVYSIGALNVTYTSIYQNTAVEASVTLGDSFGANFYVTPDEAATAVKVVVGGEECIVAKDGNKYEATLDVNAKNLTDALDYAVKVTYEDEEVTVKTGTTSVAALIGTYVNDETYGAVACAALNYGAAAQTHFNYKTDALANADLTPEQKTVAATAPVSVLAKGTLDNAAATITGASLLLQEDVVLKIFVDVDDATGLKLRATVSGNNSKDFDLVECDGQDGYKAIIDGIPAAMMGTAFEFAVVDAEGTAVSATVTYSIETYANRMATSTVADVVKAMVAYGNAVKSLVQ